MFGQLGQIAKLLGNAGKIKQDMERMQERLKAARFIGAAGGGQVQATCDGRAELVAIRIEPTLLAGGDTEMLEDLVVAAVAQAAAHAREGAKKEMESLAGELGLPGIGGMLGG